MIGALTPCWRICCVATAPPGGNEQSSITSGAFDKPLIRVICGATDGSLFLNVSWPAIVPPSSFQRVANELHCVRFASVVSSSSRYALRQCFFWYAHSASAYASTSPLDPMVYASGPMPATPNLGDE